MSTTVTYKGNTLTTATNQTRTLKTAGKYMQGDVIITDTTATPSGNIDITQAGVTNVANYATVTVPNASITPMAFYYEEYDSSNMHISVDSSGVVDAYFYAHDVPSAGLVQTAGWVDTSATSNGYVNVTGSYQLPTQAAATITPTTSAQTAVTAGKYTTGAVTVAAMPSGTAGTPTATKGTVSNHSVTVTPSVTNIAGYISGGTNTGTGVQVTAAELVSGSETKTENGTYDVTNLAELVVNVSGGGVAYVYSDLDGNGVVDIEGYKYVSCDFAPVKDDKFRFWIDVDENDLTFKAPVSVPTYSSYRYTGRIDWGDGSPQADFAYGNTDHTHTYSEAGRYCVSIWRTGGSERFTLDAPSSTDKPKVVAMEFYFISYPSNSIYGLANLRKVRYSSAQTAVSFSNCPSLADIILPDSLTTINANGFAKCTALEEITIPSAVTNIGSSAFRYSGLKEIHMLPTTPPTLGASAFDNLPTGYTIYVPTASLSSYQAADVWSNYASHITGE